VNWHVITGEYPPQPGGVSDYTRQIARGLAESGDAVHVWAPPEDGGHPSASTDRGVTVHRLPDRFGFSGLRYLAREIDRLPGPKRFLVQYVPHAFGWKAANLPFCFWIRSRRHESIWVMFHEVAYPFDRDGTLSRNALAAVNRVMATMIAASAERLFVSIPGWRTRIHDLVAPRAAVEWLPVPSAIPVVDDPGESMRLRAQYGGGAPLVGHFGTYGGSIRAILDPAAAALLEASDCRVLLLGRGSDRAARAFIGQHPSLRDRVHGTGTLADDDVSRHVSACDVMLQPYPDGISTRRTSAMVALTHARPLVTTTGWLTESLWDESGAVVLAPSDDPIALAAATAALVGDADRRARLGGHGAALYDRRFHLRHSLAVLRSASAAGIALA
jgi:glycosyltransferase involved in cell wall biosynthesis